jgi:hypothetical protein
LCRYVWLFTFHGYNVRRQHAVISNLSRATNPAKVFIRPNISATFTAEDHEVNWSKLSTCSAAN